MFMRFLQLKIDQQHKKQFMKFYEDVVSLRLKKIPGCLFAGLINSPENNEFISLTFWKTLAQAEDYEKDGTFKELLDQAKPFLTESTEWKVQLSNKMELEYAPVNEEPVIKKYIIKAINDGEKLAAMNSNMFVRVVSAKIQNGKQEEFKKIYTNVIIPELKSVKGCRYVYLMESINEKDEFISLTIWDNKEAAAVYESSGKYTDLVNKIKHTFSQFYLWKMALEKIYNANVQTTEDLKIDRYDFVAVNSFN
jgi:heme-degrading monooxygenase HmoA